MKNKLDIKVNSEVNKILDSSEKWLKSIYMIQNVFDKDLDIKPKQQIRFNFDLNSWLNRENQPIKDFIKDCEYEFSPNIGKLTYIKKEIDHISSSTPAIALGKYIMQQGARGYDIFEKNYTKIN